uniref:Uncharacterized protein n=1 Tax=Anopheles gambiae TaxID=7165 RepID=A0A2C9H3T7_ANOGA
MNNRIIMANNTFSANDDVLNMKSTDENDVKIDMDCLSQEPNNMSAKCCGQPENKPELCKVGLFPISDPQRPALIDAGMAAQYMCKKSIQTLDSLTDALVARAPQEKQFIKIVRNEETQELKDAEQNEDFPFIIARTQHDERYSPSRAREITDMQRIPSNNTCLCFSVSVLVSGVVWFFVWCGLKVLDMDKLKQF